MSRYTGPRLKIVRALGTELPGLTTRTRDKRDHPPQRARMTRTPSPDEVPFPVEVQQVVGYYATRM
ncbi:MAG TPA: hypothetical protein VHP37_19330 [Burkholderiales bacterium]|nr:hypothetical protein [Burkholderiales bacterium]